MDLLLRSWDGEYIEFRLDCPTWSTISPLERTLRELPYGEARTGLHYEAPFESFSPGFRARKDLEMIRIVGAGALRYCLCSWSPGSRDLRVEIGLWLPDSYPACNQADVVSQVRSGVSQSPADWQQILNVINRVVASCGFRRCRVASEGEAW